MRRFLAMRHFFVQARTCAVLLLIAQSSVATPGAHGPNGEHLDMPAAAVVHAHGRAHFETMSEQLEITGHLHADTRELRLYLNHFDSSAPVLDQATEVEVQVILPSGDISAVAPFAAVHGAYVVTDAVLVDALRPSGQYPLMLTVIGPENSRYGSDLLQASLHVPPAQTASEAAGGAAGGWLARVPLPVWLTFAVLLVLRLLMDLWRWRRRQSS